ncbi:transglutaminase-like domain-containing protein [Ralstonia solanacearum]|uniref:DUF3857 domain-containing protein n=2 Tax=Ralstonia solanacearum TaxID=305 RepID=A0AAP7ZM31_RALSL|nr:DUF3857 and transglutaminase domain-containing protein [Ralstonia solanacearum]MBT1537320.1 transglutaminase-like domain-containing protein [Ralstonia solanacearum]OYQ12722.1 hypothetical protein B7R77_05290 [Ralstonia solanacearum K60]QOK83059.1 DUF3857 and transglutaminase domain-containing protein [Ralstonia solanacearum]RIJ87463.1 DUF3857 domain-containing protein [Ralstonia solanacearum]
MKNSVSPGRVLVLSAAALALPCAAQTSAPAAPAAMERPAQDPAVRVVSYNESHVIGLDGKDVSTVAVSVQVLKTGALESAKQHTLSFSRSAQKVDVLEAYTLKANGRRVPVPRASWQMRKDEGRKGATAMFSDYSSIGLIFPDLAVGDSTVLKYRTSTVEPLFPGKLSIDRSFARSLAIDHAVVSVDAPAAMRLQYAARDVQESAVVKGGRQHLTWTWENKVPQLTDRNDWSVVDPEAEPGVALSSFTDWTDLARSYVERATPKAAVTPRVRQLAAQIVGERGAVEDKAHAIYDWVSQNISYGGNCVGIGAVVPRDLDVVLDAKMGDCKDHATLMQALLAAQGIASEQVLVNSGNVYKLPKIVVASTVNHVINYLPELKLFVDATDGGTVFGRLPVADQGKPVLSAASDVPTRTPVDKGDNTQVLSSRLRIDNDGSVEGDMVVRVTGRFAERARQRLLDVGKDTQARFIREVFRRYGLEADGTFEFDDPRPLVAQFSYRGTFKVKKAVRYPGSGGFEISPWLYTEAAVGRFAEQALLPVEPQDTVCLPGASTEEYVITLPEKLQVLSLPEGAKVDTELLSYESRYSLDGRVLKVNRTLSDRSPAMICSADVSTRISEALRPVLDDTRQQLLYK